MKKIRVGVLGATGTVGQRFIQLLENHPWFELVEVAASEKSAGKTYCETMKGRWKISSEIPEYARKLLVKECIPNLDCEMVFSALDASVAGEIEENFANAGYVVSSNARNHRMDSDVPLLIPEVNPGHLKLIEVQKKRRKGRGFIVTDPNCSTIHLCLAIKPLEEKFGIEKIIVTTMQAISGAGYPGVPSIDVVDNLIPFIKGEEEKIEKEPLKIFGEFKENAIQNACFSISASCNRVNVSDGHTECVSIKLRKQAKKEEIENALKEFNPLKEMNLPSSPEKPIVLIEEEDRPQPRLDRNSEKGMASIVGRIRQCPVLDWKFTLLGHNTIRGAAGAAILNAELMKKEGYL